MKRVIPILFFILTLSSFAQKETKLLRSGNKLYEQGKYKDAELNYRKALEVNKESTKGQFNLGTAVYKEKNFEESSRIFNELSGRQIDKKTRAKVFHNLGNSLLEAKKYDQSILAYKNALINDPADMDTKYNLEYAKMMLKQQQNQQNQDQQKKDQEKKDKQDQQKDQQDKKQDQNKNQPQDQKKISKEDAERMLEALKNDEKKTIQKVKKERARTMQRQVIEKDW